MEPNATTDSVTTVQAPEDNLTSLSIDLIQRERGLQARHKPLDDAHVESLREVVRSGKQRANDPAVVFKVVEKNKETGKDETTYLLADGFHWVEAHVREEKKRVKVKVIEGTRSDALRYAVRANATHGLARTTHDKERAITLILESDDPKLANLSNIGIARLAEVSQGLVARVRSEWEKENKKSASTRVDARGTKRKATINTKRRKTPEEKAAREAAVKLASAKGEDAAERLSKPAKGTVDDLGNEVPADLLQVFAARTDIKGMVAILTNMKARVGALRAADALHFAPKAVEANIDALVEDLNANVPAVVKAGTKAGYITSGMFKNLPAAERKKLEPGEATDKAEPTAVTAA